MKRYYLSPIEAVADPDFGTVYRAAIAALTPAGCTAEIPTDPQTGVPTSRWTLCIVSDPDHRRFLRDTRFEALPDVPLDIKVNAMPAAAQQGLTHSLFRFGVDPSIVSQSDGFRNVIRSLGRQLSPAFDENSFDAN